jgi:rhodanese-related sulfurtransferase
MIVNSTTTDLKKTVVDIEPQDFFNRSTPPLLIDVRSGFEYKIFHAPHAINLSLPRILMANLPGLNRLILPQWFRLLPKNQPIAVICLTAHRSPIAAAKLAKLGFTQIYNISGGMMAWRSAELPIDKG